MKAVGCLPQILLSYLIQSIIAFLGLFLLAGLAMMAHWHSCKVASLGEAVSEHEQEELRRHKLKIHSAKRHWAIINSALAEFHKAQCYFAIALQIASCVILLTNIASTTAIDQSFLLLVAVDGLIPIVLTLYTLMMFGKKSWYMIILSVISVGLASGTGGYLLKYVVDATSSLANGGTWPASCNDIGPQALCLPIGPNSAGGSFNVIGLTLGVIVIADIITFLLVLWKVLDSPFQMWPAARGWFANRLASGGSSLYRPRQGRFQSVTRTCFHLFVTLGILVTLGMEFFIFTEIFFFSPYVNFQDWSFGQIVGITTWAGTLVEVAYLEFCQSYNPPIAILRED